MPASFQPTLGEDPRQLITTMAADLGQLRDPWARHWLILPGSGRSEWLQQCWAQSTGIASRSQTLSVRALVELAASGGAAKAPFNKEALALAIASALDDETLVDLPSALREDQAISGRQLALARQLADALDGGYLCREGDERFGNGPLLQPLGMIPEVAQALSLHLGAHAAADYALAAQEWVGQWQQRGGLPHCWIQLDLGLPTVLMDRLLILLNIMPASHVHCYALAPSQHYWEDLRVGRRRIDDDEELDPGPILRSCGRRAQDLHAQLINGLLAEGQGERQLASPKFSEHLLGRLQASIRELGCESVAAPIADDDHSFSVHSCRSPLRELEVIRDEILRAMAADPDLEAQHIHILLSDVDRYAPLVMAACNPQNDPRLHIPLRFHCGVGARQSPLADGLKVIFQALQGRLEQEDLLALMENPLIAAHFNLNEAGCAEQVIRWLQDAQFRWGIDQDHRHNIQGITSKGGDLRFALRRLILGATTRTSSYTDRVGDAVPLERSSGLGLNLLADVAQLAEAITSQSAIWQDSQRSADLAAWITDFHHLCQVFFGELDQELPSGANAIQWAQANQQRQHLQRQLFELQQNDVSGSFRSDGFWRIIAPMLDELQQASSGGGGGVTIASLTDWAGTPSHMTAICGLGAEQFPRSDERPNWHPLAGKRHWGDPDRREDDRHALMLALLACHQRLIITFQGGSDEDAKERPPSTTLSELLLAVNEIDPKHNCVTTHSLNAFSPQDAPQKCSMVAEDRTSSAVLTSGVRDKAYGLWQEALPEENSGSISMHALQKLCKEPCALYLQRLGIYESEEASELNSSDPLTINGLKAWQHQQRLLRHRLSNRIVDQDEQSYKAYLTDAGHLPPGCYGDGIWEKFKTETPDFPEGDLFPMNDPPPLQLAAREGTWILEGSPKNLWYRDEAGNCHCFFVSKKSNIDGKKATTQIPLLIDLMRMAAYDDRIHRCTFHFPNNVTQELTAPPVEERPALWSSLHNLYQLARRVPLPWWPLCHEAWVKTHEHGDPIPEMETAYLGEGELMRSPAAESFASTFAFRGLSDLFSWEGPVLADGRYPSELLTLERSPLALACCEFMQNWWRSANPNALNKPLKNGKS